MTLSIYIVWIPCDSNAFWRSAFISIMVAITFTGPSSLQAIYQPLMNTYLFYFLYPSINALFWAGTSFHSMGRSFQSIQINAFCVMGLVIITVVKYAVMQATRIALNKKKKKTKHEYGDRKTKHLLYYCVPI